MRAAKLFVHKLTHWEYWPFEIVYTPVYFVWLYYSIRAKSFFFFNAANPTIKNGGFLMESKKEIYDIIPENLIPTTLYFKNGTSLELIVKAMVKAGISYPCIAKPDIGMKGLGVEKINSINELLNYCKRIKVPFLVQQLITYANEVGIFYYRYPGHKKGEISGIVYKEFLIVTGDGEHTIEELINLNPRYQFQLTALKTKYGKWLNTIPAKGEELNLVPFGNHARGAKFINATNKKSHQLETTIDAICRQIPHFYYGRLDIKFETWEDLEQGKNLSIIELNAAGSEPTHIYDPAQSLFYALKEIVKHINILYKISVANKKAGFPYLSFNNGIRMLMENKKQVKLLKEF